MSTKLEMSRRVTQRAITLFALLIAITGLSTRLRADVQTAGTCSGASITVPFTDVGGNLFFCQIAEAGFEKSRPSPVVWAECFDKSAKSLGGLLPLQPLHAP